MGTHGNMMIQKFNKTASLIGQNTATCMPTILNISEIDENPKNEQLFNMGGIPELAEYIKKEGLYQPIVVFQKNDGRYEVIAGHRKLRASIQNGVTTIEAVIRQPPKSEGERSYRVIFDNMNSRTMTPIDIARCMNEIKETWIPEQRNAGIIEKGNTKDILADLFKMSPAKVSRLLRLLTLSSGIQDKIADSTLSPDAVTPILDEDENVRSVIEPIICQYIEQKRSDDPECEFTKADIKKIVENYKKNDNVENKDTNKQSEFNKQVSTTLKSVKKLLKVKNNSKEELDDAAVQELNELKKMIEDLLDNRN